MEKLFMPYANNKGADQPAHPRCLISVFVDRCLGSIIPRFYTRNFKLLPSVCDCAGRFKSTLVENPEDRFSRDEAHTMNKLRSISIPRHNCHLSREMDFIIITF